MNSSVHLPTKKENGVGLKAFVFLMIVVIGIQGTYLGYVVGVLTTLERRFGITSEKSGSLLSSYDIGHTIAILLVGYFGSKGNLPRITGIGVLLSAFCMFLLASPALMLGANYESNIDISIRQERYVRDSKCDPYRMVGIKAESCLREHEEHQWAFVILTVGQFFGGVFAAPFNTLAYVYIDNNVPDKKQSPFFLGLLTSTYAFGPALGFGLSSIVMRIYTTLSEPPNHITIYSDEWVGAWWMGFLICGVLYLLSSIPFFFFPKCCKDTQKEVELHLLHKPHLPPAEISGEEMSEWESFIQSCKSFPITVSELCRNSVFVSMVIGWTFGSYLIGGYSTYLPKYLETQYGRSASAADLYSGIITIGAIAVSTALGGWILTQLDIGPRKGILLLLSCWIVIIVTYVAGVFVGCDQALINGLQYSKNYNEWKFFDAYSAESCSNKCNCNMVMKFDPVNFDGENFFSPCHAGCTDYYKDTNTWSNCECAMWGQVERGLTHNQCPQIFAYLGIMFVGLFVGNIFFMVTMMIVLRSVYDDQKVVALSFASCFTNLLGFIPAPILFGWIIDRSCILWHSRCPGDVGNCSTYDNSELRISFHLSNAGLQTVAVLSVFICYLLSRNTKFPEEEEDEYIYESTTPQ